jgi:hypothetical protein
MTPTERKALTFLATVHFATPAQIGQAVGGTKRGRAQGLGRLGGRVGSRLCKAGLAWDAKRQNSGYPAYMINGNGRHELAKAESA